MRAWIVVSLALLWGTAAVAQPDRFRWGQVPQEHLEMREFPDDPDAQAVVLRDFADVEVEPDGRMVYRRHRRVKLLGEGGYPLATVSLVYDPTDKAQSVEAIRGHTLIPQPDGRVRRVAMARNAIFTETLQGGRRRITFTLPALEPGAVIEFSYRYVNASPMFIPRWEFQESEPVLWSEYRVEHPRTIAYTFLTFNAPTFSARTEETGRRPGRETSIRRWVVENAPALREEPFMTTPGDYVQRLEGQLAEYLHPVTGVVRVMRSWDEVATTLADHPDHGRALNLPRAVRRQVDELTAELSSPEERAHALYDFVRSAMVWDGRRRIFAESPLARALESRRGNAAEINLLLVAMLRQAGLTAEPALLSTRDNGFVIELFPVLTQFNLTVAAVRLDNRWVLLDATDPLRPFGVLPSEALNERAWVAARSSNWITIPPGSSGHRAHLSAVVQPDGALVGTLRSERSGYAGVGARRAAQEHGPSEYLTTRWLDGVAGLGVSDAQVEGVDELASPFIATVAVRLEGYVQEVGDLAMLSVKPLFQEDENPFKRAERSFPVDFGYARETEFTADIRLPEGYAVEDAPVRRTFFALPGNGGLYERILEVRDGVLHVSVKRSLRRPRMEAEHYGAVRDFFERVATAERDVLVLRQAEALGAASPSAP